MQDSQNPAFCELAPHRPCRPVPPSTPTFSCLADHAERLLFHSYFIPIGPLGGIWSQSSPNFLTPHGSGIYEGSRPSYRFPILFSWVPGRLCFIPCFIPCVIGVWSCLFHTLFHTLFHRCLGVFVSYLVSYLRATSGCFIGSFSDTTIYIYIYVYIYIYIYARVLLLGTCLAPHITFNPQGLSWHA